MAARVPPDALGHKRQDRMAQYDEQEDKRRCGRLAIRSVVTNFRMSVQQTSHCDPTSTCTHALAGA